jgi:hypothetical protein
MTPLPSGLTTRPESFVPSAEPTLRLRQAIECLNLNLDDELHRYRQSRSGQAPVAPAPARLQLRPNRKPIDLIALKKAANQPPVAPPPPGSDRINELLGQSSAPHSQAYPPKMAVNQVRLSHGGTLTTYRPAPEEYLESTEALLGSLPTGAPPRREEDYTRSVVRQLITPLGVGALLLLLVGSASFGYLVTSPAAVRHLTDSPLARRLRGEANPEADLPKGSTAPGSLGDEASAGFKPLGPDLSGQEFTPLDLGTISTLPSATPTPTPQVSPQAVQPLEAGRGVDSAAAETALGANGRPLSDRPGPAPVALRSPTEPTVVRSEIVAAPRPAPRPAAPVASVPAVSAPTAPAPTASAPRSAAPTAIAPTVPAIPPAPVQPPQPLSLNRGPVAPPAPLAQVPPAPLTQAPANRAPAAPPAPLTQVPPASSPRYYVVTNYNGTQSLEAARQVVGDAYVRNFSSGSRIQMGAFSQEQAAQNLVNQLQGQGIPAQVISP